MGTVLTLQTPVGFLMTLLSIQLVPLVNGQGWSLTFAALALEAAFGVCAMLRLRHLTEASNLAEGRR